jgi:hypothetical protein
MSTKTNFKRVALVAVAALGLGVLTSVAPASAAIGAGQIDFTTATGSINTGGCAIASGSAAGLTYATFVNGSTVQLQHTTSDASYLSISGPAVWVSASGASAVITPGSITDAAPAATETYILRVTAVGTVKVTYAASSISAATDVITITVVAACAGGKVDLAESNFTIVDILEADSDTTTGAAWLTNYNGIDTADEDVQPNAGTGYIRMALTDEYDAALLSGAVVATATGGCDVGVANTTTSTPSISTTAATSVLATTAADVVIAVEQHTADTPATCVVSVSFDGTLIGTKTIKLQGAAAKITVSDVTAGARSGYGYYRVAVQDAAGNYLPSKTISASSSNATNVAAAAIVSSPASIGGTTSATTGAGYGKTPEVNVTNITAGTVSRYTCTSKGGTAQITVRTTVSGITTVTSAPFTVLCGGTAVDTWSVSLDKASYAPGEIATLTVSAKDSDGYPVQSLLALGTNEYSFGGMTAVTAPTSTDVFSSAAGAKTYKFSVGTTEGSFVGTFKITGSTDTAAKTLQYKIASTSTTVSNADVLKAIVSLIASINKQIAALQKALLKK